MSVASAIHAQFIKVCLSEEIKSLFDAVSACKSITDLDELLLLLKSANYNPDYVLAGRMRVLIMRRRTEIFIQWLSGQLAKADESNYKRISDQARKAFAVHFWDQVYFEALQLNMAKLWNKHSNFTYAAKVLNEAHNFFEHAFRLSFNGLAYPNDLDDTIDPLD